MPTKEKKTIATVKVKTDSENPIEINLIAEQVEVIASAMQKINASRLKRRAILLLIHDIIPASKRVGIKDIETVLDYAPQIKQYLKP